MAHGFTTSGGWLVDGLGRPTLLRGVNLSGSTKVPTRPPGATHLGTPIEGWADVSFVGRPAPLDELDAHLDLISGWGMNCLRLLTTWEAIEHAGPGCYDEEYLEYYAEVARRAGQRGLWVFVDPHHDVWSRWTGGDGAPFWCFDLAGLRPELFLEAGAVALDAQDWSENYQRVPVATMWTLFYGGDTFCPELAGVQHQLQDHYIGAVAALAERLASLDNVLGYDTLNEPSNGYIGRSARNLTTARRFFDQPGAAPWSPLEHLAASSGVTIRRDDGEVLNPSGASIWRDGCPWQRAGVWDLDGRGQPALAAPEHFRAIEGRRVQPFADFHVPFIRRFRERLRAVHPGCLMFIEGSPWDIDTPWDDPDPLVVNARHWYDMVALGTRTVARDGYRGTNDAAGLAASYREELAALKQVNDERMGGLPMLLGEYGVPYEMNGGEAFATGDFSLHERLLRAMYDTLDALFLSATQWNYTPDNTHAHGDQWNREDLSVYCAEDGGGRAVAGFSRPFARHSQGRPLAMRFDADLARFELVIDGSSLAGGPTEIPVPAAHYPGDVKVRGVVGGGRLRPGRAAGALAARLAGRRGPPGAGAGLSAASAAGVLDERGVLGREHPLRALPAGDHPGVDHPHVGQAHLRAAALLALGRRELLAADHDGALDAQPDVLVPVVVRTGEPVRRALLGGHEVRQADDLAAGLGAVVEEHLRVGGIEGLVDQAEVDVVRPDQGHERGDHRVAGLGGVGHGRERERGRPRGGQLGAERGPGRRVERLLREDRGPVWVVVATGRGRALDDLEAERLAGGEVLGVGRRHGDGGGDGHRRGRRPGPRRRHAGGIGRMVVRDGLIGRRAGRGRCIAAGGGGGHGEQRRAGHTHDDHGHGHLQAAPRATRALAAAERGPDEEHDRAEHDHRAADDDHGVAELAARPVAAGPRVQGEADEQHAGRGEEQGPPTGVATRGRACVTVRFDHLTERSGQRARMGERPYDG